MTFNDVQAIKDISSSKTSGQLKRRLEYAFNGWGFLRPEYFWFTNRFSGARVYMTEPERQEDDLNRLCLDPFVNHCRVATTPIAWQALSPDATIRNLLVWSPWQSLPVSLCSGITIPIHGPDFGFALVHAPIAPTTRAAGAQPQSVHWAHAAAISAHDVVSNNCDDAEFGLDYGTIDSHYMTYLLDGPGEAGRGQRAMGH